jgi:hypothetical protein
VQNKGAAMKIIRVHFTVVLAFCGFVKFNGGIVVGDRDAHMVVVHGAQLCYVAAFIMGAFVFIFPWQETLLRYAVAWLVCALQIALV